MTYPSVYGPVYSGSPVSPGGYIAIPPSVSWVAGGGATVSTLAPFSPDPAGPPNATPWYIPFSGFFERLPQSWDDLYRGRVEATIVDAWQGANYAPQPILLTEILNDNPGWYWPCTDPAGASMASNLAPGSQAVLNVVRSKYGAGGAQETFGADSSAILGTQGTLLLTSAGQFRASAQSGLWGLTWGNVDPTFGTGYSLTCTDTTFPPIAGGVSIECWFQTTTPFPYSNAPPSTCAVLSVLNTSSVLFTVQINNQGFSGFLQLTTRAGSTTIGGSTDYRTNSPVTQVVITFNRTSWTSYVDGAATATGTFSPQLPKDWSVIALNGINGTTANSYNYSLGVPFSFMPYSGATGHAAVYDYILSGQRINTHWLAGSTALAGEASSNRIERLLQAGNATGRRVILQETGTDVTAVPSCQDISGQPASGAVGNIAASQVPAMFFVAPTGDMFMLSKQYAWNQPVTWVLGQAAPSGQVPFLPSVVFDWDPTRIVNQIQLSQLDTQNITVPSVTAEEAASQQAYGTVSDQSTGYLEYDSTSPYASGPGLLDLADFLATTYAAPRLRLSQLTVDASSVPAVFPFVLGVSPGDMITVIRAGPGNTTITVTGRVTQTARTLGYGDSITAAVSVLIDPAPEQSCLTLDDPVLGLLNGDNILGW